MSAADDQTVQNAEPTGDNPDGKPQGDAATPPAKKAASKPRSRKPKADDASSDVKPDLPDDLNTDGLVRSGGGRHAKDPVVHMYEFDGGYGAKVYRREPEDMWSWAPTLNGDIFASPDFGRVPAEGVSIEQINAGLAIVATLGSEE